MTFSRVLMMIAVLAVAACQTTTEPQLGPDGQPLPQLYRISKKDAQEIPIRVLEAVNSLRSVRGTPPLQNNPQLTAAAAAHSQDMSAQNRAWDWGSDGSSPLDRIRRAGFPGELVGENVAETYETEIETLSAWMANPPNRDVLLNPGATELGFSWYQEPSGKIWWTMVTGRY